MKTQVKWKEELNKKGFSMVEIIVIIAIMIVLLAILTPSILRYVENSRMQKDESAMDEVCNGFLLALSDAETFDEAISYAIPNNYVTYTDSSGIYGAKYVDEEFWAPDGSGHAVTITFNPDENGIYHLAEGLVNDMTYGNGSVADTRISESVKQGYFSEMGEQKLYKKVASTIGETFEEKSATYNNSSYTVFITIDVVNGIKRADVYGEFNGTNLSPDCPASLGSGTTEYTPENEAKPTKPGGTTQSNFSNSDLTGSGGASNSTPSYKAESCGIEGHYAGDGRGPHGIATEGCTANHTYTCECRIWTVPDGGKYTMKTAIDGKTEYVAGEQLPCGYLSQDRDEYTEGDYKYYYYQNTDGWKVSLNYIGGTTNKNQTSYGPIRESINNELIRDMKYTFEKCKYLVTAPEIPAGVTSMYGTFKDCTALTTAPKLPENIKVLEYTFSGCKTLTEAPVIPNNVIILDATFMNCSAITTAPALPQNLTTLSSTFSGCSSLKTYVGSTDADGDFSNYNIPDSVTDISGAFGRCTSMVIAPPMPNKVIDMGNVFSECTSLKSYAGSTDPDGDFSGYTIPNTVTDVSAAFQSCKLMVLPPVMPEGITDMDSTFRLCESLTTAPIIPSGVTSLNATFNGCTVLKTYVGSTDADGDFSGYVIPEGVTDMNSCFRFCKALVTAPVIPSSVTVLGYTFQNCTKLKGAIEINSNPTSWTQCLYSTRISSITGDTIIARNIMLTKSTRDTNPT